jgi:TetR/AcrR family transcriptional repressor of nem operon
MPRASRVETVRNRAEIERVSSRLIRERGLSVSVADVMGAAGLTHGGFYKHFQSKDELTAIACTNAFVEAVEGWAKHTAGAADAVAARAAVIKGYLTPYSRATPGKGCPMAALAIDVSRSEEGKPVRETFRRGLEQLIGILTDVQAPPSGVEDQRERALVDLATMVGALVLARATKGNAISNEIMAAARRELLSESAS